METGGDLPGDIILWVRSSHESRPLPGTISDGIA